MPTKTSASQKPIPNRDASQVNSPTGRAEPDNLLGGGEFS